MNAGGDREFDVRPPVMVDVLINGKPLPMEVDSGSAFTVVTSTASAWLGLTRRDLRPCALRLHSYTQHTLDIRGVTEVDVQFNGHSGHFPLVVVAGSKINLLGRSWFEGLGNTLQGVHHMTDPSSLPPYTANLAAEEFPEVFQDGLGASKSALVHVRLIPEAIPRLFKA